MMTLEERKEYKRDWMWRKRNPGKVRKGKKEWIAELWEEVNYLEKKIDAKNKIQDPKGKCSQCGIIIALAPEHDCMSYLTPTEFESIFEMLYD